ncbi:Cleavage/polyadenylation specificity factor subunit 5 [Entophlyctis helioformis]|nr:Cleavage/polyadenylation specificity factor subunit 5 [Entophlyctis helioformis]
MASQPTVVLHPLSGYSFGIKEAQANDEPSVQARMARLQSEFSTKGMRESVEGVLLVHEHGHPHVLVLQVGGSFYKLPGGTLKLGEDVAKGLKRLVNEKLAPPGEDATDEGDFEVGELLSVWWRPNFDNMMYPYLPAHIKVYLVHLPPNKILSVPRNMKLLAVPLFELYENASRYGAQLAALPHVLARFGFVPQPE